MLNIPDFYSRTYYITVLTTILGGSFQFYSYGIVNPSQHLLMDWINQTYIDRTGVALDLTESNLLWSAVVSSIAVGAIFGALLTGFMSERCGRRNALICNGIFNVIGAFFQLMSKKAESPELLIVGRFILGANMGLSSGVVPMYLMEITPARHRGAAGTLHQVAVAFSDWFSLFIGLPEVLGGKETWPLAYAFPGLPALALCIILPFCPESPKYTLMTKGDRTKALTAFESLIGEEEAKTVFNALIKESALDKSNTGTFRELFTRQELRIPLIVSVLVMVAQQFTGCTAVFAYSTDMFVNARLDINIARYSTLAIGIAYFLFACSSIFLIEKVGRRSLSLFQLTSCLVALIMMSVFTALQQYGQVVWASYGTIFALIFYMCVYGVGSPIPWMITGELFNQKFRSTAVTVSVFIAWFLAFFVSLSYLPFQQLVGVSFSYMPFIIVISISIVFMFILLPETRNRDIDDIVTEVRTRSQSLSVGKPWIAVQSENKEEMRRLLNSVSSSYSSFSNEVFH